jgi:hypothetical protein
MMQAYHPLLLMEGSSDMTPSPLPPPLFLLTTGPSTS